MQNWRAIRLGSVALFAALFISAPVLAGPSETSVTAAAPAAVPGNLNIRRVVTGFDGQGKAVISSDQVIEDNNPGPGGLQFGLLWAYDDKIGLSTPNALTGRDPKQLKTNDLFMKWASWELRPGGAVGMHSTRTVDLLTILEGELTMVLDTGAVVVLKAHDVLLQRGVVHAWENHSDKPVKWTTITLGRLKD